MKNTKEKPLSIIPPGTKYGDLPEHQPAPTVPTEIIPPGATDEFDIRASKLEKQIEERYNSDWVDIFKRLAYEITVIGLQIQEACLIVGVDYEKLTLLMQQDPVIERLIKTKDLEYKRGLLKTVNTKAKTDEKLSMELLRARYPNEYNPRKGSAGGPGEGGDDLLGIAIEFIQKSGDSSPLVHEKAGKITVVKRTSEQNADVAQTIRDLLK